MRATRLQTSDMQYMSVGQGKGATCLGAGQSKAMIRVSGIGRHISMTSFQTPIVCNRPAVTAVAISAEQTEK